ncbi:MAG: glycosyl hydrolase [Burkholderiales bacterium]|nr:glycosyl hydrolase [Burkholderiales bacterium]
MSRNPKQFISTAGGWPASSATTAKGGLWSASPYEAIADATELASAVALELLKEVQCTLLKTTHGMCFSPYLEGQSPGDHVSEQQIRDRLTTIRPYTRWIRTFSCTDGHEQTPRIAHELGLKTLVGAWLGTDETINAREIAGLIEVARAGHADLVAVGNEVLLREDMSEDVLISYIRQVKEALPEIQVGYVDAYYLFEKHPQVTAACDVLLTNCYPFWEGCPREEAIAYMQSMFRRTQAVAAGKRVIISETGWPHVGTPFHGAVPSIHGAMQYFLDTCAWADTEQLEIFYFSAFDEAWKVGAEGDVGAYWGLWDKDGRPKFL